MIVVTVRSINFAVEKLQFPKQQDLEMLGCPDGTRNMMACGIYGREQWLCKT